MEKEVETDQKKGTNGVWAPRFRLSLRLWGRLVSIRRRASAFLQNFVFDGKSHSRGPKGFYIFAFRRGPQGWKRRLIARVAFEVGQVDEQIRPPLRRFGDGRSEICPSSPGPELTQHLCAFTTGEVMNLMNIGVADDQAKARIPAGLQKTVNPKA